MSLKIFAKNDYILVEPSKGMDYLEILNGISRLFSMPIFKDKNDIWVFREGQMKISYSDFYNIKDAAEILYPEGSTAKKTGIVAETGFQQGLAAEYSEICNDLPREIRVFSDLKSAEDWIKE